MPDPVSWFVIERGWSVVTSDGTEIGKVEEVVGDSGVDIFNGISVSTGFFDRPRYVPAERVSEITEGRVRLALSQDQVASLEEFQEPPPSLEIGSDEAGRSDQIADAFSDLERSPQPVTPWRRLLGRVFRRS